EGESVGEVLMKHLTAKPDVSMLAEPYRSVIARALEKDPEKRFASVEEMVAQLPVDRSPHRIPNARIPGATGSASAQAAKGSNGQNAIEPPIVATRVDEEPILRELRRLLNDLRHWWRGLNGGMQTAMIVVGALCFVFAGEMIIPLAVLAIIVYGVYRVIRAIVLAGSSSSSRVRNATISAPCATGSASAQAANGSPTGSARKQYRRPRPHEVPVRALIVKPPVARTADLLGSMLLAALIVGIMTLVSAAVTAALSWSVPTEVFAYILLVSIAGTWAILVPAKFWEGTNGDVTVRRLVMMTLGVGLGAFAWGVMRWLTVAPGQIQQFPEPHYALPLHSYLGGRDPFSLSTCVVVFGTLMLLVRWWRQADPLRGSRMSLWLMATSMFAALLVALVWQAHGWSLVTIAGITSLAVQLASPWVNPRVRQPDVEA
ncbi:MAG TPA: hypothetical protein VJL29_02915, partial [Thermoguttaceae bacterium]|nr:hypothetical protein [Thermoguttaceae bacterium]